jgi:PST family polysaccharide transporter
MQKVKQAYQKYKVMIHNFSYLTILKALTLVLPLVTFPYLIQTLGAKNYGLVIWAWSISEIFIVFIKFGFDTLGVKLISENRENKSKLVQIFSQITYVKFVLLLLSLLIFSVLLFNVDKISNNSSLFLYFMIFVVFESMLPIWYFQGIENMKIMAILVSSVKLIFALLVFIVIKEPSQYLYIPILYAVGSFLSTLIAYYIICYQCKISLSMIKIVDTLSMIKESFFILFATIGTVFRDRVTIILIEKYLGLEVVAYFDLALKIINILLTPFHMVSQVLYPHIARTKNMILLKKVLVSVIILSLIVVGIFIYNIDIIVTMVNGEYNQTLKYIMSYLIFIVPVGTISAFISSNIIIVYGRSEFYTYAMVISSVAYLIIYLLLDKSILSFMLVYMGYFIVEFLVFSINSARILKRRKN